MFQIIFHVKVFSKEKEFHQKFTNAYHSIWTSKELLILCSYIFIQGPVLYMSVSLMIKVVVFSLVSI